jgi:hypothetical protein
MMLRSGLATSAARAGKTEASIMRHGRWRSERVAWRYIRRAALGRQCGGGAAMIGWMELLE